MVDILINTLIYFNEIKLDMLNLLWAKESTKILVCHIPTF